MLRKAFGVTIAFLVGITALAAPASAAQIIYTLSGNLASGSSFSISGTGDTSTVFGFFGNVSTVPTVQLTSNSITVGSSTGTITSGSNLYFFDNHTFGVAGFNFGLTSDFFDFSNSAFSTYNAVSGLGPISVTQTLGELNLTTTIGTFNVVGATNLSFQAVVGSVPEPSSWAMMLLGFGAIGFAMRRRRLSGTQTA